MIRLTKIFPECFIDTLLVELILQQKNPVHLSGKNNIGIRLLRQDPLDFVIGVIDTDRDLRPDPRINKFTEVIDDLRVTQGLIIRKMPESQRHVIMIDPAFEKWMWRLAEEIKITPSDYNIKDYKAFKDATKTYGTKPDSNVKNFIKSVVTANPPAIQTLRTWLSKAI